MPLVRIDDIKRLDAMLGACRQAAIITHTHPDGDAIGSSIAMEHFLVESRGVPARIIIPDAAPSSLDFLTAGEEMTDASTDAAAAAGWISGSDIIIALDISGLDRTDSIGAMVEGSSAPRVLIDHHLSPEAGQFDLVFSRQDVSSACELLFYVLCALPETDGKASRLPSASAVALMTGMTTDSNNFANSVFPTTLEMASRLLEAGVDREFIIDRLYHCDRTNKVGIFSHMLSEKLHITPDGVAYMVLDRETWDRFDLMDGETEGLVNIPLNIREVRISIFLREDNGRYRVSLRSKKGWSANRMAKEYFHGGGHEQASGGKLFIPDDIPDRSMVESYIESVAARFMQDEDK